jgi:predicted nuclease with TOPRIM domain
MSHKSVEEIQEEITSIQDHLSDLFEECHDNKMVDSDGSFSARVDRLQKELELVEQIEDLENMSDYGRNSPMDQFEDYLNEVCDEIHIGTLTYSPAQVLKMVDPIAFRESYWEWANDSIGCLEDMIAELDD